MWCYVKVVAKRMRCPWQPSDAVAGAHELTGCLADGGSEIDTLYASICQHPINFNPTCLRLLCLSDDCMREKEVRRVASAGAVVFQFLFSQFMHQRQSRICTISVATLIYLYFTSCTELIRRPTFHPGFGIAWSHTTWNSHQLDHATNWYTKHLLNIHTLIN